MSAAGCGCERNRVESFNVQAPRQGLARVTRCMECGAQDTEWVRNPDPVAPHRAYRPEPFDADGRHRNSWTWHTIEERASRVSMGRRP